MRSALTPINHCCFAVCQANYQEGMNIRQSSSEETAYNEQKAATLEAHSDAVTCADFEPHMNNVAQGEQQAWEGGGG